jgi:hypothetical protein
LAGSASTLIALRAVQGIGAAILVPNSLALLNHTYRGRCRAWACRRYLGSRSEPGADSGATRRGWADCICRLAEHLPRESANRFGRTVADVAVRS